MPYVFEGGAFEDLLFKGRLKQAAVAAFEGFFAVAEQVLDHVEFLPQPAPVQQLLLSPFGNSVNMITFLSISTSIKSSMTRTRPRSDLAQSSSRSVEGKLSWMKATNAGSLGATS